MDGSSSRSTSTALSCDPFGMGPSCARCRSTVFRFAKTFRTCAPTRLPASVIVSAITQIDLPDTLREFFALMRAIGLGSSLSGKNEPR